MYNPVTNSWSSVPPPPGWTAIGDATAVVLPNGKVMLGNINNPSCAIYNPATNSWSAAASKAVRSNEETWVLLPDNTVLTVQCFPPYNSEKYIIGSNTWKNEGSLPVSLVDPVMAEIGPAMLMYNKKVIYFGANNSGGHGKTAIYTMPATATGTGTWAAGPNIPNVSGKVIISNDCPASLLPNGKVLFTGAQFENNDWGSPVYLFEYDPSSNTITQAPTPSNNNAQLFWSRMMLLPTGEVLFSPSSNNVQLYEPDGGPVNAWRPTISSIANTGNFINPVKFILTGTQLNGLSQANMYGDDCYCSTNFPIIRLQNNITNHVYFARSYDFSTMGVSTGAALESCTFDTTGIPNGDYSLTVIANGISSLVHVFHKGLTKIVEKVHFFEKAFIIDNKQHIDVVKYEVENYGKLVAEVENFNKQQEVENEELIAVKTQVADLKNTVNKLYSLLASERLPAVSADIADKATKSKKQLIAETADKG
jgi:hypothetical protein